MSYLVLTAPTHSLGLPSNFSVSVETVCDCPIAAETRINHQHTGKPKATYNCSIQGCSDRSNCKSQCSYYTCRLETCTTLHKSFVHVANLLCQPDVHRSYIACIHLIINSQASSSIHSLHAFCRKFTNMSYWKQQTLKVRPPHSQEFGSEQEKWSSFILASFLGSLREPC